MFHNVSKDVLRDRCSTFARFLADDFHVYHVSWHAQLFGGVNFCFPWQAQDFVRVSAIAICLVFSANRIVRAA